MARLQKRRGRLGNEVWHGHPAYNLKAAGSNPALEENLATGQDFPDHREAAAGTRRLPPDLDMDLIERQATLVPAASPTTTAFNPPRARRSLQLSVSSTEAGTIKRPRVDLQRPGALRNCGQTPSAACIRIKHPPGAQRPAPIEEPNELVAEPVVAGLGGAADREIANLPCPLAIRV